MSQSLLEVLGSWSAKVLQGQITLHSWSTKVLEWLSRRPARNLIIASAVALVTASRILETSAKNKRRKQWAKAGKDIVVLHGYQRGRFTPNTSPFVMKLETYLRLANIPYLYDDEEPIGSKGQSPWITLNGEEIADSQLVIEILGRKFNKRFSTKFPPEEQAVARAIDLMLTEHLAWGLRVWRYMIDRGRQVKRVSQHLSLVEHLSYRFILPSTMKKSTWLQGIGRHSYSQIEEIMRKDLAAISDYLGTKSYVLGDEPCEVDCTLFGFTSQILWNYDGSPYVKMIKDEFPNLEAHQQRIQLLLYPDWTQLCPDVIQG